MKIDEIISGITEYYPLADTELIRKAYNFVAGKHRGQTRASGEPYIIHVEEVALLVIKLKLDTASIVTALLHDSVEDTSVTLDELRVEFGDEIAQLVDGVTKISKIKFNSRLEQQAENFRKMLFAMAKDIRVLLVKLCDRTHNMRTLQFLSEERRKRISQETLEIYAPLCHRLGIYWVKSELEDLSFRWLKPDTYEFIKTKVNQKRIERESYIEEVVNLINSQIAKYDLTGEVSGRPKHFYSIYRKMELQGLLFDEIFDLIAFRVLVDDVIGCYSVIGALHAAWKPIPGRFKDYIAMPKPNNYQSLHTTVIGPDGARVEIQVRTKEMHEIAEKGIAAHWAYKESGSKQAKEEHWRLDWLKDLVESEKGTHDPREFLTNVKDDLFDRSVYVFSPKGDLVSLAAGATPLDFAYQVHTEVGNQCRGSRVNGRQVPISCQLRNGDTVEIITASNQTPSKDWLSQVVTTKAKQSIRSWLKSEERKRSIEVGKELLNRDLKKIRKTLASLERKGELEKIAKEMGLTDHELLYAEIGYGKVSTNQIISKLLPEGQDVDEKLSAEKTIFQKIVDRAALRSKQVSGVKISGMDDVVFHFAKCCTPLPGDEVVGYVTRGRGVTVHRTNCTQVLSFDARRLLSVRWDDSVETERTIKMVVRCRDQVGILALMTKCISDCGASISSAHSSSTGDGKGYNTFEVNIKSSEQLGRIRRSLETIEGVISVI